MRALKIRMNVERHRIEPPETSRSIRLPAQKAKRTLPRRPRGKRVPFGEQLTNQTAAARADGQPDLISRCRAVDRASRRLHASKRS